MRFLRNTVACIISVSSISVANIALGSTSNTTTATTSCASSTLPQDILDGTPATQNTKSMHLTKVKGQSVVLNLAVAGTDLDRDKGLACVTKLKAKSGMVLVFPTMQLQDFWDHDTAIPLEYMWLDEHGKVTKISTDAKTNNRAIAGSSYIHRSGIGKYVIIVAAGTAYQNRIRVGSELQDRDLYGRGLAAATSDVALNEPMPPIPEPTATQSIRVSKIQPTIVPLVPPMVSPAFGTTNPPVALREITTQATPQAPQETTRPVVTQTSKPTEIMTPSSVINSKTIASENSVITTVSSAMMTNNKPTPTPLADQKTISQVKDVVNPIIHTSTVPTIIPTMKQTNIPTTTPTIKPTDKPRPKPTAQPTITETTKPTPLAVATVSPSAYKTSVPTVKAVATATPIVELHSKPVMQPTQVRLKTEQNTQKTSNENMTIKKTQVQKITKKYKAKVNMPKSKQKLAIKKDVHKAVTEESTKGHELLPLHNTFDIHVNP